MKKLALCLLLAFFSLVSCKKSTDGCTLIPVKILRYDCDRVIMQLLCNNQIGDSSWTDVHTGSTYTNVVSYYNTCQIAELTSGQMDTLYANVQTTIDILFNQDCMQCQAMSQDPPQTRVVLSQLQKEPCNNKVAQSN